MPPKKLALMAAVLLMAQQVGTSAEAAVPEDDIERIRSYVMGGQATELRGFLADNPELLDGDSPLSRALAEYARRRPLLFASLGLTNFERNRLADLARLAFQDSIY